MPAHLCHPIDPEQGEDSIDHLLWPARSSEAIPDRGVTPERIFEGYL